MPSEKEINCNIFDKLELVERLEQAAENGIEEVKKQLATERKWLERKLYQQPPLVQSSQPQA